MIKLKRSLDQWPPPKKYDHQDWLAWTQADASLANVLMDHCTERKDGLRSSLTSEQAADFKYSKDPIDKLLWKLRNYESTTFKNCIANVKPIFDKNGR